MNDVNQMSQMSNAVTWPEKKRQHCIQISHNLTLYLYSLELATRWRTCHTLIQIITVSIINCLMLTLPNAWILFLPYLFANPHVRMSKIVTCLCLVNNTYPT